MEIEVREVDYDDSVNTKGIVDVLNSYASDPIGGAQPLGEAVRSNLVQALQDHPTSLVFLAFINGRPVGVAVCFRGLSTFQARPLLNVHDLAVVPECRGQGIGRALLTAVQESAVNQRCCKLTLEVQEDNLRALGLYKSFGFSNLVVGNSAPTRVLAKKLSAAEG